MDFDYTKITHESQLQDLDEKIRTDERFKKLSQASIYQMLMELCTGVGDLSTYYIGRVAQENYLDTAKLDSSVIKLSKNQGYQPQRPVPATSTISINLKGPLPTGLKKGDVLMFNREELKFSFNNNEYLLDSSYEYEFTADDIARGGEKDWSKTITMAAPKSVQTARPLVANAGYKLKDMVPISVFQGSMKTVEISALAHVNQIGAAYQWYDIDDTTFSNYFGKRDPFAVADGEYVARYGLCKIGVGKTKEEAFNPAILCDIEDDIIELNKNMLQARSKDNNWFKKLNVCAVNSNSDKTVRVYFGNGVMSQIGFKSKDDKLFVQYVSTNGAAANQAGTNGSVLKFTGDLMASGHGALFDLSPNVQFMFETDIVNGCDFESKRNMVINTKIWAASHGNLITRRDFLNYFLTLTNPLLVKHASVYGEQWVEENTEDLPFMMNNVLYTIINTMYEKINGNYHVLNVFDDTVDVSTAMLYNNKQVYLNHLIDPLRMRMFPKMFADYQYGDERTYFGAKCKQIRENVEDRMLLNTKLLSMPPIIHYYDLVGEVLVDKQANITKFKTEIENDLYKWLDENTTFGNKIYKSDIIKKFFDNESTTKVNIDLKVSNMIKAKEYEDYYNWGSVSFNYDEDALDASVDRNTHGVSRCNKIAVPRITMSGNILSPEDFGKQIRLKYPRVVYGLPFHSKENPWTMTDWQTYNIKKVEADDDDPTVLNIYLEGVGITYSAGGKTVPADSSVPEKFIFRTTSEADLYGKGDVNAMSKDFRTKLENWISGATEVYESNGKPYDLPYYVNYLMYPSGKAINTRAETLMRKGTSLGLDGLNEMSFVYGFMSDYIKGMSSFKYYDDFEDKKITSDFVNAYCMLKCVFDDNVLDDNNNIVNYSGENEISVIRIKVDYKFG